MAPRTVRKQRAETGTERFIERPAERRSQIVSAAYDVFSNKGYREATVADIANVLGIGHGTFYRYFTSKQDVFEHVITSALARVSQVLGSEDPNLTRSVSEYRDQVLRIGERLLDALDGDPGIERLLFYEAMGVSPELDEKIQRLWELAGQVTELYLANGKAKGFLRANLDVPTTALALNALIFEAGRRVVRAKDRAQARERWLRTIVHVMFDGVASQSADASKVGTSD
jgi:AcrR family transcriptional regulator